MNVVSKQRVRVDTLLVVNDTTCYIRNWDVSYITPLWPSVAMTTCSSAQVISENKTTTHAVQVMNGHKHDEESIYEDVKTVIITDCGLKI